jgi:DNA-binding SARP family transcriptional activator/energy-coupling factor transporter ATP-binding protein EcfA2
MVGMIEMADGSSINDISVRILGPIEIERGGRLIELSGRRERAVIALLLVHAGQVVSLDRMTEDLWDGEPPASAVTTLRAHVSRVRKALADGGVEDVLVTRDAGYSLRVESLRVDAAQFEANAAEGRRLLAEGAPEQALECLGAALDLWRGAPFGEVGTSTFALAEVARLEEGYKTAREDRIDAALQAGRHRELTAELDALVVEEPLRERLWGQRMLALYRSGRQADALRAYSELRTSLAEHLGIRPSLALQQLEVAMICQDPVLELAPGREPPPAPSAAETVAEVEPPRNTDADALEPCVAPPLPAELRRDAAHGVFVGRAAEILELELAWERAAAGVAQRVFLAGESGIGKTTLASSVAALAHERGGAVLLGRCDRDALTPYQPFVEALRRFVQTCSSGCLARQSKADLQEVGRLVPELGQRVPDLAPLAPAEDADRFRLFEAVTSFLITLATAHPLVIVLDDLHWADQPTCLLLRHIVRRAPQAPILILGTYRDVDLTTSHPMTDVLADLRREHAVERMVLRGLDECEVGTLVTAMAGGSLGADATAVVGTLHRETGGNPFFLREVVRHLQGSARSPADWGDDLLSGAAGHPESIREVVGRRVSAMSNLASGTLALAAVVGTSFDLEVLRAVGELDESEVLDAVDEAEAAGLIAEVPRQPGWYTFSHALIREVVYGSLSTARRLRVHRAIGEALERRTGADAPPYQVLAHHFLESGPSGEAQEKAVLYSEWASSTAMEHLAYEEAVAYLERALDVQSLSDDPNPTTRIDLLVLLGHAHWRIGSSATTAVFERAVEEARLLGDGERFARAVVGLGLDAGGFASSASANHTLIALMEEALEGVGPGDSEVRVRLLSRLAIERYFTPRRSEGCRLGDEAMAMAERLGDDRARLVALHALAWASFVPGKPPSERLAQVAEIEALALAVGDAEMSYRAEVLRQQTLLEIGDLAGADASCARMEQFVSELRMPRFAPWVRSYRATRAFLAGDLNGADELAAAALNEALDLGTDAEAALTLIGGQQMAVRIHRDGLEPIAEGLQALAADLPDQDVVLAMLPVLYREIDRRTEAVAAYEVAASRRAKAPRDATWLIYAWALGVSCRYADGRATARELYEELLPYADRWAVSTPSVSFGPISLALSGYASVLGWHDAALAHVETGLASARAQRTPLFVAAGLVELAEVLLARDEPDDRTQARVALDEAMQVGTELGLTALLARARRVAEQL